LSKITENGIFRDFEREDNHLKIYDIWNFSKATNEVKHFGNIPPEIIDNLLYYYTEPHDVIFDPLETEHGYTELSFFIFRLKADLHFEEHVSFLIFPV